MKFISKVAMRLKSAQLRFTPLYLVIGFLAVAFYSIASGQIIGTANLNIERRGHTATLLQDGKVLIVGGENQSGIVSQAEIFDPVSRTSSLSPSSASARTEHTATTLSDGRVLLIGGRGPNGLLDSIEIYDPLTSSFSSGPYLVRPRAGHTATPLSDGKILIVGGDSSGSAELYNPATQSSSLVTGNLQTPRRFHSAILLKTGQVLIVGGVAGQDSVLNSAEIYDPQSQAFSPTTNTLKTPRGLATLKLLPDGKVQVIGGDSEFSMEVYDPQDGLFNALATMPPTPDLLVDTFNTESRAALISPIIAQHPTLQGLLTGEELALLDRADQSITELPQLKQALVAGGVTDAGQVLSSAFIVKSSPATVTTDKTDYAPGEIVTITGTGWQPVEEVGIILTEHPDEYPDIRLLAVADQQGKFVAADFAPQLIDLDRTFTLTAVGLTSGFVAQTTFTDARNWTLTFAGTGTGSVTITPSSGTVNAPTGCGGTGTAIASQTVTSTCTTPGAGRITTSAEAATVTFSASAGIGSTFAGWSNATNFTDVSGQPSCIGTPSTNNPCKAVIGPNAALTVTFNALRSTSTNVSCSSGTVPVNSGTTCTATVTDTASGTPSTPTGTVTFSLPGGDSGSFSSTTCTLSSGSCSVTYTPSAVGDGTHSIGASYGGSSTHAISSDPTPFDVTVTKRSTATNVSCSPGTIPLNSSTTCTATVTDTDTAPTSTPTGTVTFSLPGGDGGSFSSTTCTLSGGSCSVTYTPSAVGDGTHSIGASYGGSSTHAISSDPTPFDVTVTTRSTATNVSCVPGTIPVNSSTTCTATVTDTDTAPTSTPTGTVTFSLPGGDGGSFSSTTCTLSSGSCSVTYTPSAIGDGTHSIGASYGGSSTHAISSDPTPFDVTVTAIPTTTNASVNPTSVQYSDQVTLSAAVTPCLSTFGGVTGNVEFKINSTSVASGVAINGSCMATTTVAIGVNPAPSATPYTVTAIFTSTNANFFGSTSTNNPSLTINKENASAGTDAMAAYLVSAPGSGSAMVGFNVNVWETVVPSPEPNVGGGALAGNINLAELTVKLEPVGPGSSITMTCAGPAASTGYVTRTFACSPVSVPVNTYSLVITIGGNYYTGGYEDVLTVYDPSLGFTTGGGHFMWPGTYDKTNFGYVMQYGKNGTNVKGSLLVIRHLPDGTIHRIKSNSLGGLSLGEGSGEPPMGWASFTGKATYRAPGWTDAIGNYSFVVYTEDRNEPGTGVDRFWLQVKDPSGAPVASLWLSNAADANAVALSGGNIVVPHKQGRK